MPSFELFELSAKAQTTPLPTTKTAKFAVFIYTNDGMHPPAFFPPSGSTDPTASGWYWKDRYLKNGENIKTAKDLYNPDIIQESAVEAAVAARQIDG